jgi:hypothetical protein
MGDYFKLGRDRGCHPADWLVGQQAWLAWFDAACLGGLLRKFSAMRLRQQPANIDPVSRWAGLIWRAYHATGPSDPARYLSSKSACHSYGHLGSWQRRRACVRADLWQHGSRSL